MKLACAALLILLSQWTNATQINSDVYCPKEYKLIPSSKICILITKNVTAHSNLCLSTGSTSTFYYLELILRHNKIIIDFLLKNNVTKLWLPIVKDEQNFLVWKLPMPLWSQKVGEMNAVTAPKAYTKGKCAMYEANKKTIFMDDCRNEHHHVCFYDTIEPFFVNHTGICRSKLIGRVSTFHNTCFEIEKTDAATSTNNSLWVVDSNEKILVAINFIRQLGMNKEKILIGMNYINTTIDRRVTIINNGVIYRERINNVRYRMVVSSAADAVPSKKSSIDISYLTDSDSVAVSIKNFDYLWNGVTNNIPFKCHYDVNILSDTIPYNVVRMNISGTTQFFKLHLPYHRGVGTIWCEAQMLVTFETITSNRLVVSRNLNKATKVLCVYIESDYCEICVNTYNLHRIREFASYFSQEIQEFSDYDIHELQLKKLKIIGTNRTEYLFHVVLDTDEPEYVAGYFERELKNLELADYKVVEVRVNDVCSSSNLHYFPNVNLNEKSVIRTICLLGTGLPPTQECIGNLIDGATWREEYDINVLLTKKCSPNLVNDQTQELFHLNEMLRNLTRGDTDRKKALEIVEQTIAFVNTTVTMENNKNTNNRYAIETLQNLLKTVNVAILEETPHTENNSVKNETNHDTLFEPVSEIIDTILAQETTSSIKSDNSQILDTIDLMAEKMAEINVSRSNNNITTDAPEDDGVTIIHKNNFIVMIVNPLVKNITGIALYKIDEHLDEKSFHDFSVRKLRNNDTINSIYNESLEITAHIPAESFDKIKINHNGVLVPPNRIIFKIYYKNTLFNENAMEIEADGRTETIESESKVIGITIPNYYERELPSGIYTMFKTKPKKSDGKRDNKFGCSENLRSPDFWGWNRELWTYDNMSESVVMCPVKRLANIGFVKLFGNKIVDDEMSEIVIDALHYTTMIGCILSLFGLIVTFVTSIIYDDWKMREATPLVLNVSTATFLQLTMFVIAESGVFKGTMYCLIIGGVLHYVTLAGFFISLFVTNCQYRRYIIVFGSAKTKYFKIKILVFGWIVPLLIVASCIIFTPDSYIPTKELYELGSICYPTDLILQLFVHAPIILIFCINVAVYIWIIIRLTQENPNLRKTPKKSRVLMQIRLFFFIFFMLSLTWAFGLLAHYMESMTFASLFNVTGPMQGFCLFIFCVVIDVKTRMFWFKFIFRTKK